MSLSKIPRFFQPNFKFVVFVFASVLLYNLFTLIAWEREHHESWQHFRKVHWDVSRIGIKDYPIARNYERKDWHDYEFMKYEAGRRGTGEQGQGVKLTEHKEIELDKKLSDIEGISVVISDKISVNRSIPDTRDEECRHLKYFKHLPSTSVIVIFHDEWLSILLRTIHSIYNRTPRELLKELILVNDNSTKPELNDQLDLYLRENFDDRVKMKRLDSRHGLIVTRLEGAKLATGEVLVFLDAHMEVNANWLPPLLEPIAISPTTVTTPTIDNLDRTTFEYMKMDGSRGVFNEIMWYQWFPLRQRDRLIPYLPHQIPIMLGAAFAIRRDFFDDIGQYDEGLLIWNGEQIELSLKLHLCGGDLLEVPCSRISHTFRNHQRNHEIQGIDVAARNFKRVGEVWMDEYKEVMYRADPVRFSVDPGDLTYAKLVKEKLRCKPFQYFLENIAPDMYTRYYYQLHYPGRFASGAIRSDGSPDFCLDFMADYTLRIQLYECNDKTLKNPGWTQTFLFTWHHKIRIGYKEECLQNNLYFYFCHYSKGREYQNWKYDINTKQIISEYENKMCLTSTPNSVKISLNPCNVSDVNQKWTWGNINETALLNFDKINYLGNRFVGFS